MEFIHFSFVLRQKKKLIQGTWKWENWHVRSKLGNSFQYRNERGNYYTLSLTVMEEAGEGEVSFLKHSIKMTYKERKDKIIHVTSPLTAGLR